MINDVCSVWQLMWSSNQLFRPNSCAKEEQSGNVAINEQQTEFQIGDIFVANNSSTLHCKNFYLLRLNYWSRLYIYLPSTEASFSGPKSQISDTVPHFCNRQWCQNVKCSLIDVILALKSCFMVFSFFSRTCT